MKVSDDSGGIVEVDDYNAIGGSSQCFWSQTKVQIFCILIIATYLSYCLLSVDCFPFLGLLMHRYVFP